MKAAASARRRGPGSRPPLAGRDAKRGDAVRLALKWRRGQPTTRMCTRNGPVRAEHDRLLDVAGARRPGDHVDRARHRAALARGSARTPPPCRTTMRSARSDGDVRVGQQRRRGRRVGAGRARPACRSRRSRRTQPVMPRRSSPDRWAAPRSSRPAPRPVEIGELGPADAARATSAPRAPAAARARRGSARRAAGIAAARSARRSTVLAMSVARCRKRATRSAGIAGRGPCACAAM